MLLPYPRAYVDWAVPRDGDGREEVSYRAYVEWLADYLFITDIPVPQSQLETLQRFEREGVDSAVLRLSDAWGYTLWDVEIIEQSVNAGVPYAEYLANQEKLWGELHGEEKELEEDSPDFVSEADYYRIGDEYRQSQSMPAGCCHADIPYRPILAALFKKIPEFETRYQLLDYYFCNFDDCASK